MPASAACTFAPQKKNCGARRIAAALLHHWGVPRRHFRSRRALRILCYHGVCADEVAGEPWVPSYFVGASEFAHQIEALQQFGPVQYLPDIVEQLRDGSYSGGPALAITFDDVAACSFTFAAPILARAGVRASFFVCSGNVTTGRLFNADVLRLLRLWPGLVDAETLDLVSWLANRPGQYKQLPLEHLRTPLDRAEHSVRVKVDRAILETLQPMNWEQVRQLADAGHDIGGHSVNHVNLGWQSDDVRRREIEESVRALERYLGRKVVGFAYPNGGPNDLAAQDAVTLRELGVQYAVTTCPGFARGDNMFALPRACIGMGQTADGFAMDVSGLLDWHRQRQQGWR